MADEEQGPKRPDVHQTRRPFKAFAADGTAYDLVEITTHKTFVGESASPPRTEVKTRITTDRNVIVQHLGKGRYRLNGRNTVDPDAVDVELTSVDPDAP